MAEGTLIEPAYVARLLTALHQKLPGSQIQHEHVRGDRYRFVVIWEQFDAKGHPQRQREVWEIAEETLSKQDLLNVAMIITLGASEVPAE